MKAQQTQAERNADNAARIAKRREMVAALAEGKRPSLHGMRIKLQRLGVTVTHPTVLADYRALGLLPQPSNTLGNRQSTASGG